MKKWGSVGILYSVHLCRCVYNTSLQGIYYCNKGGVFNVRRIAESYICISVYLSLSLYLFIDLSPYFNVFISIYLSMYSSIYFYHIFTYLFYLIIRYSINVSLPIYLSMHISICRLLSIYLSIYLLYSGSVDTGSSQVWKWKTLLSLELILRPIEHIYYIGI